MYYKNFVYIYLFFCIAKISKKILYMTVGQELTKITELKLMHNHQMIEPVLEIFGEFDMNVILELRNVIFKNFLLTDNYGLIFTMCMDYNSEFNWEVLNDLIKMYEKENAEIFIIELQASKKERLIRNKTENRLFHKKSKRNVEISELRIINENPLRRYESNPGEIKYKNFLKINNEKLSAEDVALQIKEKFNL